jgi:hypothetical protein
MIRTGSNEAPTAARPPAPPTPPPVRLATEALGASERAAQRFDAAKAALTGLLAATPAATPATTQATSNFDQYATRAVRYADALIEALNRSHEEAAHARRR